jgi:hypothetical protein
MYELVFTENIGGSTPRDARRLLHSRGGYLRLAPTGVKVGDILCVPGGFCMPVLLRLKGSVYEHVGASFVLGYMDGEETEQAAERKSFEQEIEIRSYNVNRA